MGWVQKPDAAKTERERQASGDRQEALKSAGHRQRERQDVAGRQVRTNTTRWLDRETDRRAARQTCGQGETDRWEAGRQMKRSHRQSKD